MSYLVVGKREGDGWRLDVKDVGTTSADDLPGIEPLWGRSVFHCVFCDGWEVAGAEGRHEDHVERLAVFVDGTTIEREWAQPIEPAARVGLAVQDERRQRAGEVLPERFAELRSRRPGGRLPGCGHPARADRW